MNNELKKYLPGRSTALTVLAAFLGFYGIMFTVVTIKEKIPALLIFSLLFFGGTGVTIFFINKISKFKKFLNEHPKLTQIEEDFSKSIPKRNDTVRFGSKWIFIKKSNTLLSYDDIIRVYQYIHKTNFIENQRQLIYIDKDRKRHKLCELKLRGKSDDEVKDILTIILNKNPLIKIGYV